MTTLAFPRRRRGRQSAAAEARYQAQRHAFCAEIIQIRSQLDFQVSSRGWGYILEGKGLVTKDQLDACQDLINECRKSGDLPLDICSVDENRAFDCVERVDDTDPTSEAEDIVAYVRRAHRNYHPHSFWDFQTHYVQVVVEKIDLKSLFAPVCAEFHIPIANAKGWADIKRITKAAEGNAVKIDGTPISVAMASEYLPHVAALLKDLRECIVSRMPTMEGK